MVAPLLIAPIPIWRGQDQRLQLRFQDLATAVILDISACLRLSSRSTGASGRRHGCVVHWMCPVPASMPGSTPAPSPGMTRSSFPGSQELQQQRPHLRRASCRARCPGRGAVLWPPSHQTAEAGERIARSAASARTSELPHQQPTSSGPSSPTA